jgi:hypothetical protein
VDLHSNHFWDLSLSRIDGEINGEAWKLKVTNGGEKDGSIFCFRRSELRLKRERDVAEDRKKYKYPLSTNGHLSAAP